MNEIEQARMIYFNQVISEANNIASHYIDSDIALHEFNFHMGNLITRFPQFRSRIEVIRSSALIAVAHRNRAKDND